MRRPTLNPICGLAVAQGDDESNDRFVTVGVFFPDGDDYRYMEEFDLEFDRDAACYVWNRTAGGDDYDSEDHQHYNAAGEMSYDGETFAWNEYGPKHTETDAGKLCAAGQGGVHKEVNWTDYFEEKHGDRDPYYLRLVRVDPCPTLEHTMDCTRGLMGAGCMNKTASRTHCCRDNPPSIWSQILSGCEK